MIQDNRSEVYMMTDIEVKSAEVAGLLKTMGHPKRLLILCALMSEEKTVTELEKSCGAGQSQVSQFVKRMQMEGLIDSRKEANFVYYSIRDEKVKNLMDGIAKIFC